MKWRISSQFNLVLLSPTFIVLKLRSPLPNQLLYSFNVPFEVADAFILIKRSNVTTETEPKMMRMLLRDIVLTCIAPALSDSFRERKILLRCLVSEVRKSLLFEGHLYLIIFLIWSSQGKVKYYFPVMISSMKSRFEIHCGNNIKYRTQSITAGVFRLA